MTQAGFFHGQINAETAADADLGGYLNWHMALQASHADLVPAREAMVPSQHGRA
jgi:hypothetical protein